MSYGIRPQAKVAPDAVPVVNQLNKVIPCVIRRWAITQKLNALEQLNHGIRYDLVANYFYISSSGHFF